MCTDSAASVTVFAEEQETQEREEMFLKSTVTGSKQELSVSGVLRER